MEKIKIRDKRTGAIKEIKKSLASDFIGTGNFEIVVEGKTFSTLKDDKVNN